MSKESEFQLLCQKDELIKFLKSLKDRLSHPQSNQERMYLRSMIDEAIEKSEEK